MRYILPLIFLSILFGNKGTYAQYTETINSNHPGESQGGFSVGNNVLQFESGLGFGKERHKLLNTKTNAFGLNYAVRYGLFFEALEVSLMGNYLGQNVTESFDNGEEAKFGLSGFPTNTIGLKYLIFDPWKRGKEEKPNLKSWRENHRWKWKYLIPAVSAYVGANLIFSSSPYRFEEEPPISPKFVIITQSDWKDRWVLVSNIIIDKVTTEFPTYGLIVTLTHTLNNPKWALYGEYQGLRSEIYSDYLLRGGAAYLINKDFQVEADLMFNFKGTPSRLLLTLGASYRLDWHKKDEIIRDKDEEGLDDLENLEDPELDDLGNEIDELNREIEGLEDEDGEDIDKPKSSNRVIDSFEDPEDLEELEKQKEANRSQYVEEHQLDEQEKQGKKDVKLSRKEAKKQAKLQRKLDKEQLRSQKQKDKEIERLDGDIEDLEEGTTPNTGTPVEGGEKVIEKKATPKKSKKRKKRKKLTEEEKDKELDDLDRQIKELELEFESDSKKKKEKKVKQKKTAKRTQTKTDEEIQKDKDKAENDKILEYQEKQRKKKEKKEKKAKDKKRAKEIEKEVDKEIDGL